MLDEYASQGPFGRWGSVHEEPEEGQQGDVHMQGKQDDNVQGTMHSAQQHEGSGSGNRQDQVFTLHKGLVPPRSSRRPSCSE